MLRVLLPLVLPSLITAAVISSPGSDQLNNTTTRKEGSSSSLSKIFQQCLFQEFFEMPDCFGIRAIAMLDRASRMSYIDVIPGVTFVADPQEIQQRSSRALMTEEEIENTISADPNERTTKLINMLYESFTAFVQTHSFQLRMPKTASADLERALDEGRAKIKKKYLPYLGIIAVKIFALLPLLLGFVGFLALKALLVGKIALIIAAILAFQKYSYGGFSGFGKLNDGYSNLASSYSPVSSPGGYYRRSMEDQASSQHLAYSAQLPQSISNS